MLIDIAYQLKRSPRGDELVASFLNKLGVMDYALVNGDRNGAIDSFQHMNDLWGQILQLVKPHQIRLNWAIVNAMESIETGIEKMNAGATDDFPDIVDEASRQSAIGFV